MGGHCRYRLLAVLVPAVVFGLAKPTFSADITLLTSMAYGDSWETPGYWSDGLPAAAGNDYHVGNSTGKGMRTPASGNPTFPGDSLTVYTTGTATLKTSGTITFDNLHLQGGEINGSGGNSTVAGHVYVDTSGVLDVVIDDRVITYSAQLHGSGGLTVEQAISGNYTGKAHLTNDNNTFSGAWNVTGGILDAHAVRSLGRGDVTIGANGQFVPGYNVGSLSTLTLDGRMTLDGHHMFRDVVIDGTTLADGTYSYDWLNSNFDAQFADGGGGSITVSDAQRIFELNVSQPGAGPVWLDDPSQWTNVIDGTTGVAPANPDDVAIVAGRVFRTKSSPASETFVPRLYLQEGGILLLKTSGTTTVNEMRFLGGMLNNSGASCTVAGNFYVDTSGIIETVIDDRVTTCSAQLFGDGDLTVKQYYYTSSDAILRLTADNGTFTGDWNIERGRVHGQGNGSLGTGNLTVGSAGALDADYDIYNTQSTLTLEGRMILDQDHTFNRILIGGTSLGGGTHSFSWLNANFDTYFQDGGNGSLTVVPEPGTLGLAVLAGLFMAVCRRRKRSRATGR